MYTFKNLIILIGVFCITNANAELKLIDVAGLTLGVSTAEDLKQISEGRRYEIGGFRLSCDPEFEDERLTSFSCFTGLPHYSYDLNSKHQQRKASNNEIQEVFLKGFTRKFGPPTKVEKNIFNTEFGRRLEQQTVTWKDQSGNVLTLSNFNGRVDAGVIMLESKASHQKRLSQDALANRKL
jgi:hypothetical protein